MDIQQDVNLSQIAFYQIGGKAKNFIEASSADELVAALKLIQQRHLYPIYILGLGCNLLLPDSDIYGVVLHLKGNKSSFKIEGQKVSAYAGELMSDLIDFSFINQLSGLSWAGGLPSTIGGAVRGNAGCFGSEIKDIIDSVTYIDFTDPNLQLQTFANKQCQFAYRESYFKLHSQNIIVSVSFTLKAADRVEMEKQKEIYQKNIDYRKVHHPIEYPSCGSVFKNISKPEEIQKILSIWPDVQNLVSEKWYGKVSMAYVIERLGFAGYKVGGAQVSEKHNNYISNVGNAKAADVQAIIKTIQDKFSETFNFTPDPEVQIINLS